MLSSGKQSLKMLKYMTILVLSFLLVMARTMRL